MVQGWGWSTDEEADPARAVMPLSAGMLLPFTPPTPTFAHHPYTLLCTMTVLSMLTC